MVIEEQDNQIIVPPDHFDILSIKGSRDVFLMVYLGWNI